jgi:hypothetical protein
MRAVEFNADMLYNENSKLTSDCSIDGWIGLFLKQRGADMIFFKNALKFAVLVVFINMLFPQYVYSYIDPGTGSYLFQIIIAAFVAISFAVKVYWQKIKGFISRLFAKKRQ